jgi:CHAT domain-containing protein
MIDFHKALKQSAITPDSKARALQQAALTVMNDPRYRHPYFWAGFVLIGNSN